MTDRPDTERILTFGWSDLGLWGVATVLVIGVCAGGALALERLDVPAEPRGEPELAIFLEVAEEPVSPSTEELELPSGDLAMQSEAVPQLDTEPELEKDKATPTDPLPAPEAERMAEAEVEPEPEPEPRSAPAPEERPVPTETPDPEPEPDPNPQPDETVEPNPVEPVDENPVTMPVSMSPELARRREKTAATVFTPRRAVPPPSAASQAAAPPPAPTAAPRAAAPKSEAGARPDASDVRNWQSRVMRHLAQRRQYPRGASQRREQGVATVRFSIGRGGEVLSAKLVQSSGYAQIDEAAIALVHRSSPLPAPPAGLPSAMLTLTAPIEYRIR